MWGGVPSPRSPALRTVLDTVAAEPAGRHTLTGMAARAMVSERHLTRLFRRELGITPGQYVTRVRRDHAPSSKSSAPLQPHTDNVSPTRRGDLMSRPVPRRVVLGGAVAGAAGVMIGAPAASASQTDADLSFPTTRLARRAHTLVSETQEPSLRYHSLRSFLFARAAAGRQGKRPNEDYDLELVYLICVLHDMGLTAEGNTDDQQFEATGADIAARFLEENGITDRRVDTVWDAIALHTTQLRRSPVFLRRRPAEIAIALNGVGIDAGTGDLDQLPPGFADRVHARYPRLGGIRALSETIEEQALANPRKAPPRTLAGELVHQRHPSLPYVTWDMAIDANPWGD